MSIDVVGVGEPCDTESGLLLAAYHSSRRLGNCPLIRAVCENGQIHQFC